jgi:hypothetical protein
LKKANDAKEVWCDSNTAHATVSGFWILDFGFWIKELIQNPKSKIQNRNKSGTLTRLLRHKTQIPRWAEQEKR